MRNWFAWLMILALLGACGEAPEAPAVEEPAPTPTTGTLAVSADVEGAMAFARHVMEGRQNKVDGKQGTIFPEHKHPIQYLGKVPQTRELTPGDYEVSVFYEGALVVETVEVRVGEKTAVAAALVTLRNKEMVAIPAGDYRIGRDLGDPGEGPCHDVRLDGYHIDRNMVTNQRYALFEAYIKATRDSSFNHPDDAPSSTHKAGNKLIYGHDGKVQFFSDAMRPCGSVRWFDAWAYAKWAGKRLPTEAEWEVAAGWDSEKGACRRYPWGDEPDEHKAYVLNKKNKHASARIDEYPEDISAFGVRQMGGNLMEWCADSYSKNYYARAPRDNPVNTAKTRYKVVRGGCGNYFWGHQPMRYTTYARKKFTPGWVTLNIGFRCVRPTNGPN